ncbi:MAG: ATP-dependent zinc metalloprotease FtsH [Chlamydiales bacterium]|nr:ATP-dependent zinc metalloprotease FtsH [Chlamydiales bacterium]
MNDDKKPEPKKSFSNSLVLIVMGVILALIVIQNFIETKVARVSFSYQLESLVNLDLIQPEDSRKTAATSNLVTFAGRFRDRLTDEGKSRYKYLELLDNSHELAQEKTRLQTQLGINKKRVEDAAGLFLRISGQTIPAGGYNVFDELYDTPERRDHIVIQTLPEKTFASLADIQANINTQNADQTINEEQVLVRNLRSPLLGIGNEQIKQTLRTLDTNLSNAQNQKDAQARTAASIAALSQLTDICKQLNQPQDHITLTQLRSVRAYKDTLDQVTQVAAKIDDNQSKLAKATQAVSETIWFFNNQELSTRALEKQDPELFHQWFVNAKEEWQGFDANKGAYFKAPDQPINKVLEKTFKSEEIAPNYVSYLLSIAPVFLILFLLYLAFSRQMKGMGSGALDFSKSPARLYPKGQNKITFKDVAGIDECLEELQEIVEFLKNPQKFTALGGRIPKGVLTIGSPGTGKTLVAKAVAGEADCPFFSISGSDFVEMFVGVGASRIRKMFEEAKKNAPCIIFMDEIDAVGRHRGGGVGGGHDEREQTLNQLLVEMDGFDTTEGIIIIAATNRPDVLDKALLRPGRFDRQVYIPLPDIKGRFEILKVHARKIKMDSTVDLMALARSTPGCSGADLANLLNEAALLAARNDRSAVTAKEVFEARDKVLYGKERRSLEIDEQEKKTTAFHESGHAVVGCLVKNGDPIDKVTIIPRGYSLGATQFLPKKNRLSYWKTELLDQLAVLMGGRAAEEIFVHDVSSGAKQDIERATSIARSMVCEWGMSDKLGTVTYDERSEGGQYLVMYQYKQKMYSESTAQEIDKEVKEILQTAYAYSKELIQANQDIVILMTDMLMEFETIDAEDVEKMMKREWNTDEKRTKIKQIEDLHKKTGSEVTPPPAPPLDDADKKKPEEQFQLQTP